MISQRPFYYPHIKVPTLDDCFKFNSFLPSGGKARYTGVRKSFSFDYWIDYPAGRVFQNRKCRFVYIGSYTDGGIFSSSRFTASLRVFAYPSADYCKEDGFAYIEDLGMVSKSRLSDIEQKFISIGNAMARDLQNFLDSKEIANNYYDGDDREFTSGGSRILTKLGKRHFEVESIKLYMNGGEYLTEYSE